MKDLGLRIKMPRSFAALRMTGRGLLLRATLFVIRIRVFIIRNRATLRFAREISTREGM
jgi:hypothetical protein